MKITNKQGYGPSRKTDFLPFGSESEIDDGLALKLISNGMAIGIRTPRVEPQVFKPVENAVRRVGRPKSKQ